MISARPRVVETRTQVGHWEGDLLVGNRTTAVVTLVERKTRFLVMAALPGKRTAEALNTAVAAQLGRFPRKPPSFVDMGSGQRDRPPQGPPGEGRYRRLPVRPQQSLATWHQREHQRAATPVLPQIDGLLPARPGHLRSSSRRTQQPAPTSPRVGNTPPSTDSRDCIDTNKGSAPGQADKTVTAKVAGQLHRSARAHAAGHQPPGPCPPAPEPRPGQEPEPSSIRTPSTRLQRQLLH